MNRPPMTECEQIISEQADAMLTRAVQKIFKPGAETLAAALARIQELQTENENLRRKLKVTQDILAAVAKSAGEAM